MKKIYKITALALILTTQLSAAKANFMDIFADASEEKWNDGKIYLDFEGSASQSFWSPGLGEEDPNNSESIIKYKTEGLGYYNLKLDIGYDAHSIFTYKKLSSFVQSENQQELLKSNGEKESGIDGYTVGISPEALVSVLDLDKGAILSKIVNTVLSYRFEMTDTAFFGAAIAQDDIVYQGDLDTNTSISQGDSVNFKTTFKEQRHTVSSRHIMKPDKGFARIGVYSSEWSKPTSLGNYTTGGDPLIELAEYTSKGITLVYSNYQGTKLEGLNFEFGVDYGLDNSFTTVKSNPEDTLTENESLAYSAMKADISYKYIALDTKYQRLSLIIGATYDNKSWSISDADSDAANVKLDEDTLSSIYGSIRYRFAY